MKKFELPSIIGSAVAVGITLWVVIRTDIADVRTDIRALEHQLAPAEQRQARTEGLLEGLRDAIMATKPQDPPGQKEST